MISFSLKDCRRFTPISLGGLSSKDYLPLVGDPLGYLTQSLSKVRHAYFLLFSFSSAYTSELVTQPQTKKACHFCDRLCDSDWIRTNGPHLRRMTLYPAELPNHLPTQCNSSPWGCKIKII